MTNAILQFANAWKEVEMTGEHCCKCHEAIWAKTYQMFLIVGDKETPMDVHICHPCLELINEVPNT